VEYLVDLADIDVRNKAVIDAMESIAADYDSLRRVIYPRMRIKNWIAKFWGIYFEYLIRRN
jgi:hypothetical protein